MNGSITMKGLVTGERFNHNCTVWSSVNGFGHMCRVWSGVNGLVSNGRFGHGGHRRMAWSHIHGSALGHG